MTVGTNVSLVWTSSRKITVDSKENTCFKKNAKSNVSSKNLKKGVKENVFSKQMVSKMKLKTKTESGMLKENRSVGPKIDTTRFVDMSAITRKPTCRRRNVSNYLSTNLSAKKAKASTSVLDQEGKITYNKFSTTYYNDLLKIPPIKCISPFGPWRTSKNLFSGEIAARPNRLTSFMCLKKDAKDQCNSISETDVCNTTPKDDDEDITNTSSSISKSRTLFFSTNIETEREVSSLATDSLSTPKIKLHDVTPKSPKLRKSGYEDGNKKNDQKVTNDSDIKADQYTEYFSTASSSIIKVRPHDVTPKLGKSGYGDGNEKNVRKVTNFYYDITEEDKNVASTGSKEEITIEDSATRRKMIESVENGEIFNNNNNTRRHGKSRSRHKEHRTKCVKNDWQLVPNLSEIGDCPQHAEIHKLISINNDCTMDHAKTESYLEMRKAKYKNATHSATEVKRPKSRSKRKNRKNSETSKKITNTEPYSEDQKRNNFKRNNLAHLKSAVRTYSNMESQKGSNSEINDNDTVAYAKENRRPESSDSQESANFVCSTMNYSGERPKSRSESEKSTNDENSIKMAYPKEITKMESNLNDQQKRNIKIHLTLASPKNVKIKDCYIESHKGANIEANITISHDTENRSQTRTGFVCNTMHYRAVQEGPKSRSESQKTSNTVAYPKEITNTEFCSSNQEKIIIFYLIIYFLFLYLTQYVKTNNTLASPKSIGMIDSYIESQKRKNIKTNNRYRRRRSSDSQKCNTKRPTSTPERQNGANFETSGTTVYPKEVPKVESFSYSREESHIETNNTLAYPTGVTEARFYLENQKGTMINTSNTMSYPKLVKIVESNLESKSRIHYKTNNTSSCTKEIRRAADSGQHYNTKMVKSKSYSESQSRTNVETSIATIYHKNVERGEPSSESQEKSNSADNNSRQYTTGIERPKSCPESEKRMVSFIDIQKRLTSLYANITHCMTDFERTKCCLAYIERAFPNEIENVESYSDIQNRINIIYRNIKHFTIELEKAKEWQKHLYIY